MILSNITFALWFVSALCSISSVDISVWPSCALKCSGVNPAFDSAFAFAPYSNKVVAISIYIKCKNYILELSIIYQTIWLMIIN